MLEKNDIRKIQKGDILHLTDFQSLEDDVKGINYTITNVEHLPIADDMSFWIFNLENKGSIFKMTIIENTDAYEVKMFFSSDDYPYGFRTDILEAGNLWLFLPPENPNDFYVEDLEYAPFIIPNFSNNLLPADTEFETYGFKNGFFYSPDGNITTMIKEYKTKADILNPFFMVIEKLKDESQGYITTMQGSLIEKSDITLIKM